jgi:hypothetical protein
MTTSSSLATALGFRARCTGYGRVSVALGVLLPSWLLLYPRLASSSSMVTLIKSEQSIERSDEINKIFAACTAEVPHLKQVKVSIPRLCLADVALRLPKAFSQLNLS